LGLTCLLRVKRKKNQTAKYSTKEKKQQLHFAYTEMLNQAYVTVKEVKNKIKREM
jgi:hypothetical protein